MYRDFVHMSTVYDISIDDLILSPGVMYRIVLKLCAKSICFQTVNTDGVMVIANPPVTGGITVEHLNTTVPKYCLSLRNIYSLFAFYNIYFWI
jgi:hypothetical protein